MCTCITHAERETETERLGDRDKDRDRGTGGGRRRERERELQAQDEKLKSSGKPSVQLFGLQIWDSNKSALGAHPALQILLTSHLHSVHS